MRVRLLADWKDWHKGDVLDCYAALYRHLINSRLGVDAPEDPIETAEAGPPENAAQRTGKPKPHTRR